MTGTGLDVDRALDGIPGTLDADHPASKSTWSHLQAAQLAAAQPAEQGGGPERLLARGKGGEQLVGDLGGFDSIAAPADGRHVEVVGRVYGDLVAADRSAEDDPGERLAAKGTVRVRTV
ncbi:MAG: hypothetical protein WAK93_12165 [Solirubrobacteraceae bacterium]